MLISSLIVLKLIGCCFSVCYWGLLFYCSKYVLLFVIVECYCSKGVLMFLIGECYCSKGVLLCYWGMLL